MVPGMLMRQVKVAWVPLVVFLGSVGVAVGHSHWKEGSAGSGRVEGERYFLSMGHGGYQETSAERFAQVLFDERVRDAALVVAVVSVVWAAWCVRRAGLPVTKDQVLREPRVLRPRV